MLRGLKLCFLWVFLLLVVVGCVDTQRLSVPSDPQSPPAPEQFGQQPDGRNEASLQLTAEGYAYLRSEKLGEAMSKFQKAIALSSSNPYAYYFFGEARYLRKEFDQSLSLLERAELLLRDKPIWLSRIYALRGRDYEALSRRQEAKEAYQRALKEDQQNLDAQVGLDRLAELDSLSP